MSAEWSRPAFLHHDELALRATSAAPAWAWSTDARRILWANPVGAAVLGATSLAALQAQRFDPGEPPARHILQLSATLFRGAPPRLARLRGLGAPLGGLLLCTCSRISLADAGAVLVVGVDASAAAMPLAERVRRLLADCDEDSAAFFPDGRLIWASPGAERRLAATKSLEAISAGLAPHARAQGRAVAATALGWVRVDRIGSERATVLVARFQPPEQAHLPEPAAEPVDAAPPLPSPASAVAAILPTARRYPLRFTWQMDAGGRFSLGSDEFTRVIGPRTALALGRPWAELAGELGLDPDGEVLRATATGDTWSGITVFWPVDDCEERLAVELAGLPVYDRARTFLGYRGVGVCRDVEHLALLRRQRRARRAARFEAGDGDVAVAPARDRASAPAIPQREREREPERHGADRDEPDMGAAGAKVVPFPAPAEPRVVPSADPKSPVALSPGEHNAFRELARKLNARLSGDEESGAGAVGPEPWAHVDGVVLHEHDRPEHHAETRTAGNDPAGLLDRFPVGVLVYRLDQLLYANRAFLDAAGYPDLAALAEAGGLDCLTVEAPTTAASGGTSMALALRGDAHARPARLFPISWKGDEAHLLLLTGDAGLAPADASADAALRAAEAEIRDLRAILDAASDGLVVVDHAGRIQAANKSAQALFERRPEGLADCTLADLLAPESRATAAEALARAARGGSADKNEGGVEVVGATPSGAPVVLLMRIRPVSPRANRFCIVFRNPSAKAASRDAPARATEPLSSANSDFLAKISHEVRTPLNSILGFAEIMLEERFGALGNERYREYLEDIRMSASQVVAILSDLTDISKVEAGKLELSFSEVDLNEIVQSAVRSMQPQANRDRIIIRRSLTAGPLPVTADARALRQIVVNLLSSAMESVEAGRQVIISTGHAENGGVALRIRDTGAGMSPRDLEEVFQPFRQSATSARASAAGLSLPLAKALAEANRGTFKITSKLKDGTMVEVVFPPGKRAAAE